MEGHESLTALFVSAARGLGRAATTGVLDPFAKSLLPGAVGAAVGALTPVAQTGAGNVLLRLVSGGLVLHIELRTLAIDMALTRFLARRDGAQVLLLGAGADARGYRILDMQDVPLFEVDHPSTQTEKRARAATLEARAEITYVPVDFERDSLRASLERGGFDRARPTFVIWEGVTMYLTPEAARGTLGVLREILGDGSALAMTYAQPELSPVPRRTRPLIRSVFSLIGEPLRGLYSPAEMRALLVSAGFSSPEDTGPFDWAQAFTRSAPILPVHERLALATLA